MTASVDEFAAGSSVAAILAPLEGALREGSLVDATAIVPELRDHDLLVAVQAVSVNPVDVKLREIGPGTADRVLGWDASGTVIRTGRAVTAFQPGDEVWYAGAIDRPGSYSHVQAVDERIVARKPSSLSAAESAAMPLTALTAYEGLFDKLRLTGESTGTLLIVGGAGGVGSMVIQLAKKLTGLRVIATASRPDSVEWVKGLGADATVDYRGDLAANVAQVAPEGVNYIFSTQSRGNLEAFVDMLEPFGEIVAIDDERDLDLMSLKNKALTWHWEFMFGRSLHQARDIARQQEILAHVAELVDAGTIRSTLTKTLSPLDAEQMSEAHALVESGSMIGKVVVAAE